MKRWISSAVIYQVNLRSLAAREPRNAIEAAKERPLAQSPLAYVRQNLSVLKRLGANVLYFMPPYPIGIEKRKDIGSPYSIRDFRDIEPEYGTLDEMKDLVQRAHAMKLKVIFDITPNHTSRDHVWMTQHPEYYVKAPDGSAFYDCDWNDTAKLDYTQPGLRKEMLAVYDYWLGFLGQDADGNPDGIDGFRLDMAHFINDKRFWNEAMPQLKARHAHRELLFLAECYGMDNNLDLFARGINAAYDDDFYKVCVNLYGVTSSGESIILPADDLAGNESFRDRYEAFTSGGIAAAFERALMNYEERLPKNDDTPRLARYTDNHDEGRGHFQIGAGATRAVSQLIFLANHTIPFILTGQEFGALNRPSIHGRLYAIGKTRRVLDGDKVRSENAVEIEGNVFDRGMEKRAQWYSFYRDLIRLRRKSSALCRGSFTLVDAGENCPPRQRTVIAFERKLGREVLRCAVNLGPEARLLRRADTFRGEVLYGTMHGEALPPFSSIVTRD